MRVPVTTMQKTTVDVPETVMEQFTVSKPVTVTREVPETVRDVEMKCALPFHCPVVAAVACSSICGIARAV